MLSEHDGHAGEAVLRHGLFGGPQCSAVEQDHQRGSLVLHAHAVGRHMEVYGDDQQVGGFLVSAGVDCRVRWEGKTCECVVEREAGGPHTRPGTSTWLVVAHQSGCASQSSAQKCLSSTL